MKETATKFGIKAKRKNSYKEPVFLFTRYNDDVWKYVSEKRLKEIVNVFFKTVKKEIRKSKTAAGCQRVHGNKSIR